MFISWQKTTHRQLAKYTTSNIEHYLNYLRWIATADPTKVKFMDECHFAPKGMFTSDE